MSDAEPIDEELEGLLSLDGPGPARRQSAAAEAALLAGALDAWQASPPMPAPEAATAATGAVPWAKVALIAAAVGGLVGAGVTAALLWRTPAPVEAPVVEPVVEAPVVEAPVEAPAVEAPPIEAVEAPVVEEPEVAPIAEAAPLRRPAPVAERPEDLIARGNQLRSERRWAEAEAAYTAAARAAPGSATSHVADVAAAAIRLEHRGDPAGAVARYQRALAARPNGPLALEAREGIARAERRRGRAAAERAALEAIVTHHAGTAAAARARARLDELGP